MSRLFLLLTLSVALVCCASAVAGDLYQSLGADNECAGDSQCSMTALQFRASKTHDMKQDPSEEPAAPAKEMKKTVKLELATNPIIVKGNMMYDSITGKRFFAKGTAYNPRNDHYQKKGKGICQPPADAGPSLPYATDVTTDEFEERWSEDLQVIADLGANTIRLFNIDPSYDHTKFMEKAASLGIYVILPLNHKEFGFLPAFPAPECYTKNMTFTVEDKDGTKHEYGNVGFNVLSYGKRMVKHFSKFPNTLLFTVNNEFGVLDKNGYSGFQCVKALTRDIHQYQSACGLGMRRVPLIYSAADVGEPDRRIIAKYLTCERESSDDVVDVYGLNVYSWCNNEYPDDKGEDNFNWSPYQSIYKDFKDFSVPVIFTEFGCNIGEMKTECPYKGGRTWADYKHIVGELGEIVSGAIAYTYNMDYEERGLVMLPNYLADQPKIVLLDNYYTLQKAFATHDVPSAWDGADAADCHWTPAKAAKLAGTHSVPTCPSDEDCTGVQKRRRVDNVTDWKKLPLTPGAALKEAKGQEECPHYNVTSLERTEACCHMKCEVPGGAVDGVGEES